MKNLKLYKLINIMFFTALAVKKGSSVYNKENILILVVDDLRPLLADWGDAIAQTPNIGALAANSVLFKNAFAQQSLCGPSRNSFLTGRRPDSLHLYDFYSYWRETVGNYTTLPQYFKELGYKSYSIGKVFHPGKSSNFTDDFPHSWSVKPYHPSTQIYKDSKTCIDETTGFLEDNLICPVVTEFQPEGTLPDIQIAKTAVEILKQHKRALHKQPYFMAVGFHKPHIPLRFPNQYLEFYPLSNMTLPYDPFYPYGMPTVAWNPWTDFRQRHDISKLNIPFPFGTLPAKWTLKVKQSYYAALTYIDDLIGTIIREIDLNTTIVVFTSDHGWSLGEHGEWAKYSNFDVALKVPLIIHVPGLTDRKHAIKTQPKITEKIVELIDLFPTLAELSGATEKFPQCPENEKTMLCSEGFSLVPLIYDAAAGKDGFVWNHAAFSQYPRPGLIPKKNSDKPRLNQIRIMGYTIRTERHRYTEWVDFNHTTFEANWNIIHARELYDHLIDENEIMNLSDRKEVIGLVEHLSEKLRSGWRAN